MVTMIPLFYSRVIFLKDMTVLWSLLMLTHRGILSNGVLQIAKEFIDTKLQ